MRHYQNRVGLRGPTLSLFPVLRSVQRSHLAQQQMCVCSLARQVVQPADSDWTANLAHYSGYSEAEISGLRDMLSAAVKAAPQSKQQAVLKKYGKDRYSNVSSMPALAKFIAA